MKSTKLSKCKTQSSSKSILAASIVFALIASSSVSAFENEVSNNLSKVEKQKVKTHKENLGFGTGALIGGIAAGPLGAIVAGVGGAFIAKYINKNDENEELNIALSTVKETHRLSKAQVENEYLAKLELLESSYQKQLVTLENQQEEVGQLQASNLLMSLQFSTGSSDIAPHYNEQISALANILTSSPKLEIDLSGYTDLTGEESLNQILSKARVDSVKALLIAKGVDEQKIATFAYGEAAPVVANNKQEVSFYDRRVVMKLHKTSRVTKDQMANNN
jgi:sortase system peptidoglycan-associated protein